MDNIITDEQKVLAYSNWVRRYAKQHNMNPLDVAELALFKLEGIKYEPIDKSDIQDN